MSELKTLEYDLDQVREHNDRLIEGSNAMQDEIEALNKHMNLITSQNYELSNELQRFLQTDEMVKNKLNRRSIVDEIKSKVDSAIRKSQHEVQSRKSPTRPGYDQQQPRGGMGITPMQNSFDQRGERIGRNSSRPIERGYANERSHSPLRDHSPPRSKYNGL